MPARRGRRRRHSPAQYGGGGAGGTGAAPSFAPTDVAGLGAWWDFSDASTLFTDTGRTTPVASDADVIKGVTDKSGTAHHLSEATNGPQYKVNIQNSKSVGRFDGSNDLLTSASISADASVSLYIVAKKTAASAASKAVFGFNGSNNSQIFGNTAVHATHWLYFADSGAGVPDLGGTVTNWSVVGGVYASAASVTYYVNGTAASAFNPNDDYSTATTVSLGAADGLNFGDYDIGEVLYYTTAHADVDRDAIESYLGTKWNITVA